MKIFKIFIIFYSVNITFGSLCDSLRNNDYILSDNTKKNISNQLNQPSRQEERNGIIKRGSILKNIFEIYFGQKYLEALTKLNKVSSLFRKQRKLKVTPSNVLNITRILLRLTGAQELQTKLLFKKEKTNTDPTHLDIELTFSISEGVTIINGKMSDSGTENTDTENVYSTTAQVAGDSYCTVQIIADPQVPLYKKLNLPYTITIIAEFKSSSKTYDDVKMKINATDRDNTENLGYGLISWIKQNNK